MKQGYIHINPTNKIVRELNFLRDVTIKSFKIENGICKLDVSTISFGRYADVRSFFGVDITYYYQINGSERVLVVLDTNDERIRQEYVRESDMVVATLGTKIDDKFLKKFFTDDKFNPSYEEPIFDDLPF